MCHVRDAVWLIFLERGCDPRKGTSTHSCCRRHVDADDADDDDADANHPGCGDDLLPRLLLLKTCPSDTGATSSSSRISYSQPHSFLICCPDDDY
mmetsp:Transcript_29932/g.34310  ORF Transcript_29932/g.34310 Transcript_29932/m.34310 type:complete len:95 (+) Transcript_29932:670-954(+)